MSGTRWKAAWTGGQYSFVRAGAATLLACLLLQSAFTWDDLAWFPASLVIAAIALALGIGGRALAAMFATLLPFGLWDASDSATSTLAGTWLFFHLLLPLAPYGSMAARGRTDPAGRWRMPGWYPFCCQVLFVVTRLAAGVEALYDGHDYLAVAFVLPGVLGLLRPTELAGWSISFVLEMGLALGGDGSLGAAWLLHLLTFQPAWIPRREGGDPGTVFYDGSCALCHGAVRFLIAEDVYPPRFRIAPLDGPTFVQRVPESVRVKRPDSIVVVIGDHVLLRGAAVIAILDALGGIWWMVAACLRLLPRGLVDAAYDLVAARRYRWFGRRSESCPIMTESQRVRMDA